MLRMKCGTCLRRFSFHSEYKTYEVKEEEEEEDEANHQ